MEHEECGTSNEKSEQCQFYIKIGACRHGEKCSRIHTKPTISQTIIVRNMYRQAKAHLFPYGVDILTDDLEQSIFDEFFEEVFTEIEETCGRIREMHVCENHGAHLSGNVYIKFSRSSAANRAVRQLKTRFFAGALMDVELSPVMDFHDASCRQHQTGCCSRGGICNFMHIRIPSAAIRTKLNDRFRVASRNTTPESEREEERKGGRNVNIEKEKNEDLPSRYQPEGNSSSCSSVEKDSSESDGNSTNSRATPKAFRTDRFNSGSDNDSGGNRERDDEQRQSRNRKMRLIRQRRWAILRAKMDAEQLWDEEKERNYVFSLL